MADAALQAKPKETSIDTGIERQGADAVAEELRKVASA